VLIKDEGEELVLSRGEVDFLPVVTFLDACVGATVGTLTAPVISLLVLRSGTTRPPRQSEFQ
jgi:hypothetical protein